LWFNNRPQRLCFSSIRRLVRQSLSRVPGARSGYPLLRAHRLVSPLP
jgi:hypothetical protein